MIDLIKALRPPECLLVVILGFIGFKYASIPSDNLTLTTLFFVIAVTMLQNDWRDRRHDIGKGKTLAHEKSVLFLSWLILFWIVSVSLIVTLFLRHPSEAVLLFGMAFIGAVYSETRYIAFLSVIIVSFTVASPLLLPLAFGATFVTVGNIFIATVFIMFGRETLHDIADMTVDKNYKKTVAIVMGDSFARTAATITLIIGCGFAVATSFISLVGSAFIAWGLLKIRDDVPLIRVRRQVDIGLALLGLGLLFF